ncbi:MAG: Wzz/FepE/Etk N-terminal domain-containing protein [Methylocystis sp.]|uniref:Wzz/FepE/Etk N-terminal domain-containing protein n=1 Tax=Methylocystis sp. TaxID=1911079 RepID=UPI003D1207EC
MRRGDAANGDDASRRLDLRGVGRLLLKRRWLLIGPTLAAGVGALLIVNIFAPRYSAEARLLLENQQRSVIRAGKSRRIDQGAPDAEAAQRQIELLTSRDLARRIVESLRLSGNDEFDSPARSMGGFGPASGEERIFERFSERLAVRRRPNMRELSIEFSSRDPGLAARAANAVAEGAVQMQQAANRAKARTAAQALATRVSDLKSRVADAEARVEMLRARQVDAASAEPAPGLAPAVARAKADMLTEMLRQGRFDEIAERADDESIRRIDEQRFALRGRLARESQTLLWKHPQIKELNAQLASVDAQLRTAVAQLARALETQAQAAGAGGESLRRAPDSRTGVTAARADLPELERAAGLLRTQLGMETARYQDALARAGEKAAFADARIVQRALVPQFPAMSRMLAITAVATFGAFALAAAAIVLGEWLRGGPGLRPERGNAETVAASRATGRRAKAVGGTTAQRGAATARPSFETACAGRVERLMQSLAEENRVAQGDRSRSKHEIGLIDRAEARGG